MTWPEAVALSVSVFCVTQIVVTVLFTRSMGNNTPR